MKKVDLVVVVDSLNIPSEKILPFVDRIFTATKKSGLKTHVKIAMHSKLDPSNTRKITRDLADLRPGNTSVSVADRLTFAFAYLKGLERAANEAKYVIELDSGGGHLPEELPRFIKGLEKNDVVLSSRFTKGGINTYPLVRQIASRGVTWLSNTFLNTDLTDAASGFQGFRSEVLKDLFLACPPDTWVSATDGPFHMYQTDIRARLSWMPGLRITEVPITYGAEKIGSGLSLKEYVPQTIKCFWKLYQQQDEISEKLRSV